MIILKSTDLVMISGLGDNPAYILHPFPVTNSLTNLEAKSLSLSSPSPAPTLHVCLFLIRSLRK